MSVSLLLKDSVAAPTAGTRPADSGGFLLAGFLKELERSNCISLKVITGFWLASLGN